MAHWHDYNPWADRLVYCASLDEWLDCLAGQEQREVYLREAQLRQYMVDCYILPQPSGQHSMGMRYGADDPEYFSPMCNAQAAQQLINRYCSAPQHHAVVI